MQERRVNGWLCICLLICWVAGPLRADGASSAEPREQLLDLLRRTVPTTGAVYLQFYEPARQFRVMMGFDYSTGAFYFGHHANVVGVSTTGVSFSALWFAMVLLSNSGLFLLQGAEFLSAATIIIYAGAIIVTFLFVIMLAQPQGAAPYDLHSREPLLSCTAGIILCWTLLGTLNYATTHEARPFNERPKGASTGALPTPALVSRSMTAQPESIIHPDRGHVDSLGRTLFLDHYVSVEVIGMLLLVAVVGAVLIANRDSAKSPARSTA